jgi:hypothetical protein
VLDEELIGRTAIANDLEFPAGSGLPSYLALLRIREFDLETRESPIALTFEGSTR